MENNYCHSCAGPLEVIGANKNNENLCQYCGDENGKLLPKDAVATAMGEWLKSWAPIKEGVDFKKRALKYMEAMPAWN